MKRLYLIGLVLLLLLFAACSSNADNENTAADSSENTAADSSENTAADSNENMAEESSESTADESEDSRYGGTLNVAFQNEWAGLDPHTVSSYSSYQILNNVLEGL
nr:hypothetical protein [Phycisphaerae bacterium]NIT61759.1 hypothetical protein [Fodinibius sp.]NIV16367.1 hypothetical protein [Fodinibius sp.]NIY30339.1 hypothetical protein [Fodinibius sp.]